MERYLSICPKRFEGVERKRERERKRKERKQEKSERENAFPHVSKLPSPLRF